MRSVNSHLLALVRCSFGMRNIGRVWRFSTLIMFVTLAACEDDASKLKRLETEKLITCLAADGAYEEYGAITRTPEFMRRDSLMTEWREARLTDTTRAEAAYRLADSIAHAIGSDTLSESWSRLRAQCEVATRKYEQFMR